MRVELTERDKAFLGRLNDYGILSTRQIKRRFFPEIRTTTMLARLRKLRRAKLLERISGLQQGIWCWWVSKRGAEAVGTESVVSAVNRNLLEHDTSVSELRLKLEEVGVAVGWKSGHALKKATAQSRFSDPLIPDGLCLVQKDIRVVPIAIEVELNAKTPSRYRSLLREYADKQSVMAVWYLVSRSGTGHLLDRIRKDIYSPRQDTWLMWSLLGEVLSDPLHAKVYRGDTTLTLRDLVTVLPPHSPPHSVRSAQISTHVDLNPKSPIPKKMNEIAQIPVLASNAD